MALINFDGKPVVDGPVILNPIRSISGNTKDAE